MRRFYYTSHATLLYICPRRKTKQKKEKKDKKKCVSKSLTRFYSFLRDVVVSKRRFQATKTRKDNDMCTPVFVTVPSVVVRCPSFKSFNRYFRLKTGQIFILNFFFFSFSLYRWSWTAPGYHRQKNKQTGKNLKLKRKNKNVKQQIDCLFFCLFVVVSLNWDLGSFSMSLRMMMQRRRATTRFVLLSFLLLVVDVVVDVNSSIDVNPSSGNNRPGKL